MLIQTINIDRFFILRIKESPHSQLLVKPRFPGHPRQTPYRCRRFAGY
ncbi:hypothetical protein [Neptunomonas antarctica]|nr:hypothetical protein [Neptunomonas antarctica]